MKSLRVIRGIYVGIDKQFIFWYNHAELFFIISAIIGAFIMSNGNKTANTKRIPTQEDLDIFDKIYEKYNDNGFITFQDFAEYIKDEYEIKISDFEFDSWTKMFKTLPKYHIIRDDKPHLSGFKASINKASGFVNFIGSPFHKFSNLAELCEKEDWGVNNQSLKNYFDDYVELIEDDINKYLSFNQQKTKCCFNIGLHTRHFSDIFACLNVNAKGEKVLDGFYTEANRWLSDLDLPEPYTFSVNFDTNLSFRLDREHILDNKYRIPEEKRESDKAILADIEIQAKTLKRLIKREPHNLSNLIVPICYKRKVCFLFPIFLTDESIEPEILLTCEKQPTSYLLKTILTPSMDTPYRYARIIGKPNVEWLKPKGRL